MVHRSRALLLLSPGSVVVSLRSTFSSLQVVNLFNMFITYGDTFLPTSNSYDELYYEIVRMHQVFDNLYCMGTPENTHTHTH